MTTIQKIAAALKQANEEIHAHVRYNFRHETWEVWVDGTPVEVNFKSHDEAEDRCENLNYEYAARKVLGIIYSLPHELEEAMKNGNAAKYLLDHYEKLHF